MFTPTATPAMTDEQRTERNTLAAQADVTADMLIDGLKLREA